MAKKRLYAFLGAGILCAAAAGLSLSLGAASFEVLSVETAWSIFLYVRLPRTLACLLAGAALAVSGAVIQGVLHNKLASPGIIGINAGAGLAVTVSCALGFVSGWAVAGAAFGGAIAAVLLVVSLARKTGASRTTVILAGVAMNAVLNALSEALTTLVPEIAMMSGEFRVGGFSAVSYPRLIPAGILIILSLIAVLTLGNELDVLVLGEEMAQGLGLPVRGMRTVFLILAALLAGSAVSFSGLLGFVGLLVPHGVRKLVGGESRYVLPLCAIGGAGFVTVCDLICRVLFMPYELPVGIGMSVIGGPVFLFLLLRRKGGRNDA